MCDELLLLYLTQDYGTTTLSVVFVEVLHVWCQHTKRVTSYSTCDTTKWNMELLVGLVGVFIAMVLLELKTL